MGKIVDIEQLKFVSDSIRAKGGKCVFTNGCFDVLHLGHLKLLQKCKELGTVIVGLNSDESIKKLKGSSRPINNLKHRIEYLELLPFVDYIVVFEEETPINVIEILHPDYLVKGNDYKAENIVGYAYVKSYGGSVLTFGFDVDQSSSNIINKEHLLIKNDLIKNVELFNAMLKDDTFISSLESAFNLISDCYNSSGKLLIAGNGGSCEQANHLTAELVGHFKESTKAYPAISLCNDVVALTALSNDYSYELALTKLFIQLYKQNDLLFLMSTSGSSKNIINLIKEANKRNVKIILLTSIIVPKEIEQMIDCCIKVPSIDVCLIQQAHLFILHNLVDRIKK